MRTGRLIFTAGAAAALMAALVGCGGSQGGPVVPPLLGGGGDQQTPVLFECPPLPEPATSGPGTFDDEDGFTTVQKGILTLDHTGCSSTITDVDNAENWMFQGGADQVVIISVTSVGPVDPQLSVLDPNGEFVDGEDNHGEDLNPTLTVQLPADGIYTLRVSVVEPGSYTISVRTGTVVPEDAQP